MSDKKNSAKDTETVQPAEGPKEYSGEVISEFKTVSTEGKGKNAKILVHKVGSIFKTISKRGFERLQNEYKIKK